MSANKFKVGDKVKVREGLVADEHYGGVCCDSSMVEMGGEVLTIDYVERDYYYRVKERAFYWTDEMLEPAEKTLDNLCVGDFVVSGNRVSKILAAVDGCYLLSDAKLHIYTNGWYTVDELKEGGYSFIGLNASEPTIEILGKKYKKADVEETIKDLEPIG